MGALPLLVPLVLILTVGTVICVSLVARRRSNVDIQKTLRAMIENGQQLTPELLEKVSNTHFKKNEMDLRRGVIAIALGIGIFIFGVFLTEDGNLQPILGIASIPIILGIAYLGLWKFSPDSSKE